MGMNQKERRLKDDESLQSKWRKCAERLRAFAIGYSDHPKRNPDDKLAEVLEEYDHLCNQDK